MAKNNRIVWSEGTLLGPQHFQQQDRFLLNSIANARLLTNPYPFGFSKLKLDTHALSEGKISLLECEGCFADGSTFRLPEDSPLPMPVVAGSDATGQVIYLGLPFESHTDQDIAAKPDKESFSRYLIGDEQVSDRHSLDSSREETLFTAKLWTRLLVSDTDDTAYHTLPLVRIKEVNSNGGLVLDEHYHPCASELAASIRLQEQCRHLHSVMLQRTQDMATRLGSPDAADTNQLTEFLRLQIINRATPLLKHIINTLSIHPEAIYQELLQLNGELATYCTATRLATDLPAYDHRQQQHPFDIAFSTLQNMINAVPDQKVNSYPVNHIRQGVYLCTVPDINVFHTSRFILAVSAGVEAIELRTNLPRTVTIASKDKLGSLVQQLLTGVALLPVVQVPNSIPMYDRYLYFDLDRHHELWNEIAISGEIALHVAGKYPEIKMELWVIEQ